MGIPATPRQRNSENPTGSTTTKAITLPLGVNLGNLLVVSIGSGANNVTITPPDASWTQAAFNQTAGSTSNEVAQYFLVVDVAHQGGTSWTWTFSSSHSMYICIEEWPSTTGWPANPVDKIALGDTVATPVQATLIDSGTTATTTQAEELWVGALFYNGSAQTESSITAGWTKDLESTRSGSNTMTMLYQVVNSMGAANVNYTIPTAQYWSGCVVTYKDLLSGALTGTIAGAGTLSATLSVPGAHLTSEADGVGTLTATLSIPVLPAINIAIAGVLVFLVAGTLQSGQSIGRRAQATFHVLTDTTVHYQQFQQVQIFNAQVVPIFSGYIQDPTEYQPGFQNYLVHEITCIDQHYLADKRIIAKLYRNQTCGFIANDIVTNILSAEGVTVGQIQAGATIPIANFGYVTVADAMDALVAAASQSGVPYYWMIDQNLKLWFVPYAAILGPTLDGTQIDSGKLSGVIPKVKRQNVKYRNTQYAAGGVAQTGVLDETRQGDSQTRAFTYSYALSGVPSLLTLNGSNRTLGTKGQTGYQYYWAQGDPTITQDSSQPLLASTDRLRMVYIGQFASVFTAQNAAQVAAQAAIDGTSGINEAVLVDNTILSAADGNAKVSQQLTQYGLPGSRFVFATLSTALAVGQLITVNYPPLGIFNNYRTVVLADSPVRYYRLDELSGTVANDSGSQAQNGTITGVGITYSQPGAIVGDSDGSMGFNGSSGSITLPTTGLPTAAAPWTIEAWSKMTVFPANNAWMSIAGFGTDATKQMATLKFLGDGTAAAASCSTFAGDIFGPHTLATGTWYHVVGTYDGTSLRLYVNGTLVAGPTAFTLNIALAWANIGADTAPGAQWLNGNIDEVAIYTYALTPAQVTQHYAAGHVAPATSSQMLVEDIQTSDQQDGFNPWNTVTAVAGPYDTSWVDFFNHLFKPATIANSISLGVLLTTQLAPSTTLAPSLTLFPGD